MTLSPSETCRHVADIVDFENERFDISIFQEERECGTVACIAGHTALLHEDSRSRKDEIRHIRADSWIVRQGRRLGLTPAAACQLFYSAYHIRWLGVNSPANDRRYSLLLRQLEKELEDRDEDDLIDVEELEQIAEEALN